MVNPSRADRFLLLVQKQVKRPALKLEREAVNNKANYTGSLGVGARIQEQSRRLRQSCARGAGNHYRARPTSQVTREERAEEVDR